MFSLCTSHVGQLVSLVLDLICLNLHGQPFLFAWFFFWTTSWNNQMLRIFLFHSAGLFPRSSEGFAFFTSRYCFASTLVVLLLFWKKRLQQYSYCFAIFILLQIVQMASPSSLTLCIAQKHSLTLRLVHVSASSHFFAWDDNREFAYLRGDIQILCAITTVSRKITLGCG